eukprot:m.21182 g.21182  ORF g.21182 m.21182 type:complete len:61 (+) comp13286_c1_seq1:1493-1675(+)
MITKLPFETKADQAFLSDWDALFHNKYFRFGVEMNSEVCPRSTDDLDAKKGTSKVVALQL